MDDAGTYILVIFLKERSSQKIGKLGTFDFSQGYYIYAGSALRNLNGRLKRHLRPEKRLHWHIDYLLMPSTVTQIWYSLGRDRLECAWNAIVASLPGAVPFIPGFGSSDCRCRTHLTYFKTKPSISTFRRELRERGFPELLHRLNLSKHSQ
jgi:Uri superfamily endonuclease